MLSIKQELRVVLNQGANEKSTPSVGILTLLVCFIPAAIYTDTVQMFRAFLQSLPHALATRHLV